MVLFFLVIPDWFWRLLMPVVTDSNLPEQDLTNVLEPLLPGLSFYVGHGLFSFWLSCRFGGADLDNGSMGRVRDNIANPSRF